LPNALTHANAIDPQTIGMVILATGEKIISSGSRMAFEMTNKPGGDDPVEA